VPTTKAVMFCLMDVSGSMTRRARNCPSVFFILLYLFLTRHYDKIELVFIRHHTQAQEVDEENFFHARETGGTVVSSALVLMDEIIKRAIHRPSGISMAPGERRRQLAPRQRPLPRAADREPARCAATSPTCRSPRKKQNLWEEYTRLQEGHAHFAMRKVTQASQIYPCSASCSRRKGQRHDPL